MFLTIPPCAEPAPPQTATVSSGAAEAVGLLMQVAHRLRNVLADHFAEFDLSDVRFHVLHKIRGSVRGCSQTELADELAQSESSISTLIERMRKDDLLYRLRSDDDRRKWILTLTARGRALLDRLDQCHVRRMSLLMRGLDAGQQRALVDLLRQLLDQLSTVDTGALFERIPALEPLPAQPAA